MAEAGMVAVLVRFADALRAAGVVVGSGDVLTYSSALARLDATDLVDLYWVGRTTLVTRREDIPTYHDTFLRFFLNAATPMADVLRLRAATAALTTPATESAEGSAGEPDDSAPLGWQASAAEVLRHKSFAACTEAELAALRKIMAAIRLTPPRRRTRRTRPARTGRTPDLRRTIRASLRTTGEPVTVHWRARRVKPRPLILILDVSGSMADYSRALLQFAYSTRRAARKVDVFCFGTRLTRLTAPLQHRSPDEALRRAAALVVDWEGGTRIGGCLDEFVRTWGRRGSCRGGIVVICSDGLDRGDPDVLATAIHRLSLLCHRIVWLNPHTTDQLPLGMTIAKPHIDELLSGHDLASLTELAALLPKLG
ncbi:MAG TPA: VWA domain-containing protein [Pseudonocardiaceae bacterium]